MPPAFTLAIPFLLLAGTVLVFKWATRMFGREKGYLLGFGFYWFFWCLFVPWLLLGRSEFFHLFADRLPLFSMPNWPAALLWIIVTLVTLVMYGKSFIKAPLTLILLAFPLATFNGFCEEILWRGLFVRTFPDTPWLGILYPAVGFALWHLAPQIVFPVQNNSTFIISTLFLGLVYGFISYSTGSVFWTAISHSLSGFLALSGYLAPSVLALFDKIGNEREIL